MIQLVKEAKDTIAIAIQTTPEVKQHFIDIFMDCLHLEKGRYNPDENERLANEMVERAFTLGMDWLKCKTCGAMNLTEVKNYKCKWCRRYSEKVV